MKSALRLLIVVALGFAAFWLPAQAAPKAACDLAAGDYIVSFKNGVNVSNELKNVHGRQVTPKFQYDKALNGFAGKLSADEACELKGNPRVEDVELDGIMSIDALTIQSTTPSWGLDRVDQNLLPLNNTYQYENTNMGTGVTAYVIDTGILTSHSDFGSRARTGYDAITPTSPKVDCNGHGTHVAGTIGGTTYGVAKNVSLVAVRVLDCNGSGSTSGVINGINWVIGDHGVGVKAVANMSLGGGASTALDTAIRNLVTDGVTTVVAAGNSGRNAGNYSPARVSQAITVGASDRADNLASYSNYGTIVDVIAPGTNITSDWFNGATNTISGTSMATPHVAGVMALYLNSVPGTYSSVPTALMTSKIVKLSSAAKSAGTTSNLIFKSNL